MSLIKLDTGFNIEIEFVITPFHKRFFAWIIDLVVLISYYWLMSKLISPFNSASLNLTNWLALLAYIPALFYHLICEFFLNGQSFGKKAMSIQVISMDGGQPSISQYLIRWLFRSVDFPWLVFASVTTQQLPWWCMAFCFTGIGCVIATPYSQRVGDLVAGTVIIDRKTRTSWQDTVFTEIESGYQPKYPSVMQLSDKDINTLKSIIETVRKNNNYDLSMRIAERIKSKLNMTSDQDSLDFLETLLKDYNYYTIQ